jgi:hypothetical protein
VGVPPSESFRDGALVAVNLGDDADTTGAVYGQLAGAFYGEDGIPSAWREKLALRGTIERFAELLHGMSVARGRRVSGESALTRATREVADEWRSKGVRCPFRRTDLATETTTSSGTRSNGVCGTTPRASDGRRGQAPVETATDGRTASEFVGSFPTLAQTMWQARSDFGVETGEWRTIRES